MINHSQIISSTIYKTLKFPITIYTIQHLYNMLYTTLLFTVALLYIKALQHTIGLLQFTIWNMLYILRYMLELCIIKYHTVYTIAIYVYIYNILQLCNHNTAVLHTQLYDVLVIQYVIY